MDRTTIIVLAGLVAIALLHVGVIAAIIYLPSSTTGSWIAPIIGGVIGFFAGLVAAPYVQNR